MNSPGDPPTELFDDHADTSTDRLRGRTAAWMALLTVALLIPFGTYRYLQGDLLITAVIAVVVVVEAAVVLYVYRGGSGNLAVHVPALMYSGGAVAGVHLLQIAGTFWIYPVVVANFYSLPLRSALMLNAAVLVGVTPILFADLFMGIPFIATLLLVFLCGLVFSVQVRRQRRALEDLALIDPLTRTSNRRAMAQALVRIATMQDRHGGPQSLIMLDLDHFKALNDRFGHDLGDRVLSAAAHSLTEGLRGSDMLFRFGGEEFVVLMPHTDLESAAQAAERMRSWLAELRVEDVQGITASFGVAERLAGETVDAWLSRADRALYQAKDEGRDRVRCAPSPAASRTPAQCAQTGAE